MVTYVGLNNELSLDDQGDLKLEVDGAAVEESIELILTTRVGERPMRRDFGSYIPDLLFEPITEATAMLIELEVLDQIPRSGEDRVIIEAVVVYPFPNLNFYELIILYRLRRLANERLEFRRILRATGEV